MAKITWRGGRDLSHLQVTADKRLKDLRAEATAALDYTTMQGANMIQDLLEDAVTPTGEKRVESGRGRFAGRHDSGTMVGSVNHEIRNPRSSRVNGVFGWWGGDFERYFYEQDNDDTQNYEPARALPNAYMQMLDRFKARMERVARGVPWK